MGKQNEITITRQLKLSTGRVVTVYPVPQNVYSRLIKQFPYPPIPVTEVPGKDTATGEAMRLVRHKDPEYNRQCEEIDQVRMAHWSERQMLWGLRDEWPPEDWEAPTELLQYEDPNWQPRPGKFGQKLDWIELDLLAASGDMTRVINAINELAGVDEELTQAIEETFRGPLAGEAA